MVPQWRPDGKALLFESRVDGQMDLMTLSITDP
jgi:Tol biopolymer transport system component